MKRKKYQIILLIIYITFIVFYSILSLQSGDASSEESGKITRFFVWLFNLTASEGVDNIVRKLIGHFGFFFFFAVVSSFLYLSFTKIKITYRIILNYLVAILYIFMTEFLFQKLANSRGPSLRDCGIDFLGFFLSSLIIFVFYFVYNNAIKKQIYADYKKHKIYQMIVLSFYIIAIVILFVLTLQNNVTSSNVSDTINEPISEVGSMITGIEVSDNSINASMFLRKLIGHIGYYGLLSVFSLLFYFSIIKMKKYYLMMIHFGSGIILALFSEFVLENIASGRCPYFNDFLCNIIGFFGVSIISLLIYYLSKRQIKEENRIYD